MFKMGLTAAIVIVIFLIAVIVEHYRDDQIDWREAAFLGSFLFFIVTIISLLCSVTFVHAHDGGQWETSDPAAAAVVEWYRALMQPDNPNASCCGEADAYWADETHVRGGKTYARITDDRPDEPRQRPHIPIGTEFEIPDVKLKWDRSNPTGHQIIFLSRGGYVYCFVQGSGI